MQPIVSLDNNIINETKLILVGIILLIFSLRCGDARDSDSDSLRTAQQLISESIRVNNIRTSTAAGNMANSKTAGYIPKNVIVSAKKSFASDSHIKIDKIIKDKSKVKKVYDPAHPAADAEGMVLMPDIDPLVALVDMNEAKSANERAMRMYQAITDQRNKTLQLANN